MVIAVVSVKGGTGKSTVTLNLAGVLAARYRRVLVVDADPQGSIACWTDIRRQDDPAVLVESAPLADNRIRRLTKRYDLVLFDSPPTFKKRMKAVIQASDRLIIPVSPGIADVWSTRKLLDLYRAEKERRPKLDARLLISRIDRRTRAGREFRSILGELSIPIFVSEISQRAVYNEAWSMGMTVDRLQPRSEGARDFRCLADEVVQWLSSTWLEKR